MITSSNGKRGTVLLYTDMDFSSPFIIEHYIIVVQTVRERNVGLCASMGCPEKRA